MINPQMLSQFISIHLQLLISSYQTNYKKARNIAASIKKISSKSELFENNLFSAAFASANQIFFVETVGHVRLLGVILTTVEGC